ncbi:SGNH/GDSL hydrolase family protein [Streptococcus parauberis]|uniref:GDSL-like protein n=2 Tax=Streptococcus parauberis TaxID=1348 RepID=F1Z297_9STRE|nr:SGNH/GDSL hydrolase family protein [Streptococcus parauberis]EGE53432.1 GDSL-like protein [Streptococcus parauberis NCFD 2020]ONH62876.1 Spore germination lipase LipC [Streptococcus parauberis]PCH13967.1 Spore germination lipase LipC [Streptococcus parauberis]PNY20151.1 Spore germination lipase LipC [Streptococcus parauberis]
MNKIILLKDFLFFATCLILSILFLNFVIPNSDSQIKRMDYIQSKTKIINYVALGDSLTEGVGDSTGQGGFVPLLANDIRDNLDVEVSSQNYGISGNTSQQILKRMQSDKALKNDLKKADILTITVGGNDVMAVIRKNLANLKVSSFELPEKNYQLRLQKIVKLARKDNNDLHIYILGIYNPFYLNFPEMTEMQNVINNWNNKTKEVTSQFEHVHYVPINKQLYRGIDGQEGIVQSDGDQTRVVNDALFNQDHFHPNNIGYQIMSDAVLESILKYEKK